MGERLGGGATSLELMEEAMSRLLVLRPREPIDLLRQLCRLKDVFAANPVASLLVVDSMSAWQPLINAFPRSVAPVMKECWHALARLQHELCIAVVVTYRDLVTKGYTASTGVVPGAWSSTDSRMSAIKCCHLAIARSPSLA